MSELTINERFVPLKEKAIRKDGTLDIRIIQPGWGTSGFYSESVLRRDIPTAFPVGTHMMWNHPTTEEEAVRPEGDLRHLAAVTVGEPYWNDGDGMHVQVKPFAGYAETIDEIAPHIGVSIRGMGTQSTGEAEGRKGVIVDEITQGKSIDFVTAPGAGGAILQVFESAPDAGKLPDPAAIDEAVEDETDDENPIQEQDIMTEELKEAQNQLEEAMATVADLTAENAKLTERLLLQEAAGFVAEALAKADLPDITRERLAKQLQANPPIADGKIIEADYTTAIETAVTEAQAEIAATSGQTGRITGQGTAPKTTRPTLEESKKRQDAALAELGYGGDR